MADISARKNALFGEPKWRDATRPLLYDGQNMRVGVLSKVIKKYRLYGKETPEVTKCLCNPRALHTRHILRFAARRCDFRVWGHWVRFPPPTKSIPTHPYGTHETTLAIQAIQAPSTLYGGIYRGRSGSSGTGGMVFSVLSGLAQTEHHRTRKSKHELGLCAWTYGYAREERW